MIDDLDSSLEALLNDPTAPDAVKDLRGAEIRFETPGDGFTPDKPTVNLFLHSVVENHDLRDPVPLLRARSNGFVRHPAPLRLDCIYLVTAWSKQEGELGVLEEHKLLAQAVQWLSHFPTIPSRFLKGALSTQPFPPPTLIAQPENWRDVAEFWVALRTPPRPAFCLVATIALPLDLRPDRQEEGALVTTLTTGFDVGAGVEESLTQIGGRVLGAPDQGVEAARVALVEARLETTTDSQGRYRFARVPAGTHTLRVLADGFEPKSRQLLIPGSPAAEYEITLTPI